MERTTHPFTPEEVMAYLDGELSPERATAAAAHLEHCSECRAVAAELRSVSQQLAGWLVEAAPESFAESTLRAALVPKPSLTESKPAQAARGKDSRRAFSRGLLWWGSAFAAAAVLLVVFGNMYTLRPSKPRTEAWPKVPEPTVALPPAAIGPTSKAGPPIAQNRGITQPSERAKKAPAPPAAMDSLSRTVGEPRVRDQVFDGQLARDRNVMAQSAAQAVAVPRAPAPSNEPKIIRRATMALLTKEFDSARAAMENLVKAHQGYFGQLEVATPQNAGRALQATVRVPAAQLDAVLVELRKLGQVEQENQSADDVTGQYVDLTARLANARETEKRLVEILRERTGKVSDVLEVEEQISSVRQQIEQMDAQRKTMENQIQYASVDLRITEEYKQSLETPAPSLGTRIHNAAVDGFLGATDLLIGLLLFLLNAGPTLLLLAALLGWPAWRAWLWLRRRTRLAAGPTSQTA